MKVEIIIEDFDNGISLKWKGENAEPEALVALDRDKELIIGKTIWDDIKLVMDSNLANVIKLSIEYESIKEEQQ